MEGLARGYGVPCVEIEQRDAVDMMCEAVNGARALAIQGAMEGRAELVVSGEKCVYAYSFTDFGEIWLNFNI